MVQTSTSLSSLPLTQSRYSHIIVEIRDMRSFAEVCFIPSARSTSHDSDLRELHSRSATTMNSPPEPDSPLSITPSSALTPQTGPTSVSREHPAAWSLTSQLKKTTRTSVLHKLNLRKEDMMVSIGEGGKQERGGLASATSSLMEGTQRAMGEELVDPIVASQLKWSGDPPLFPARVADRAVSRCRARGSVR